MIEPGATIGILGGGQLGRMTGMAARSLGYDPSPLHSLPPTEKPWRKRVQDCTESVLEVWLDENLAIGRIITDEPGPSLVEQRAELAGAK